MNYCLYFQAHIEPKNCWFLIAVLKAEEHVAFVRTCDTNASIVEFFVPESMQDHFLHTIDRLKTKGIVDSVVQMPNRIKNESC